MAGIARFLEAAELTLGRKIGPKHWKTGKSQAGWHDWNGNCWTLGIVTR